MLPCGCMSAALGWAGSAAAPTGYLQPRCSHVTEGRGTAVGERFSIIQEDKYCASPGSCAWNLLGYLDSCC